MTDKQKSLAALAQVQKTCDAALDSIAAADGIVPDDLSELKDSEFSTIHKDFLGLLAYLYSATTKTALSLKPSSPTYSASSTPLKDLSDNVARLASNVRVVRTAYGATILKEMQSSAQSVVAAIHGLTQTLISDLSSSNEPGEEYLSKVGEIHHAIDRIRGSNGLSSNNVAAAHKIWTADQGSLTDALSELQEMAESKDEGDDVFDDGWDELGLNASQTLAGEELERLKKIESIIKLCNLLHKTVAKRVLSATLQRLPVQPEVNTIVDDLAKDSATFPAAVDDLISTVYSPQDTEEMVEQLHHMDTVLAKVQSHLTSLFELEPIEKMLKESVDAGKKSSDVRKWFGTCFDEIKKLTSLLSTSLRDTQ
ncbi:hypothetical protein FA13DRAFT_1732759 [Coprinellus micaceus]|uniref:Uncharacterized protein n=1 Tax=Coprinellus micaceus TaxID=71717 RepID=A0A4Y7TB04_COPMI|nr:hypothetical protein FA13DRAFT_1732759 [Coprinellus micaceus]